MNMNLPLYYDRANRHPPRFLPDGFLFSHSMLPLEDEVVETVEKKDNSYKNETLR